MASLTGGLLVSGHAVAAAGSVAVDLSPGVALGADVVDEIESWEAPAGPDDGVPDLVLGAGGVADSVGGLVDLGGRAQSAGVADEVVSLSADTLSVDKLLVGVAGRGAEAQVFDETGIAVTGLGDGVVGGLDHACVAGSISHLEQFRHTNASLLADIVDLSASTGDSAKSESLVVDLVPGTLSTDSSDGVEPRFAAAGAVLEDFIDSASDDAVSGGVRGLSSWALAGHGIGVVG